MPTMTIASIIILTSVGVFILGAVGLFRGRGSFISTLIAIELLFLSVSLMLVSGWLIWQTAQIPVFSLFVLGLSGAEVAVGLALVFGCFKSRNEDGFLTLRNLRE
ncbi:MAG: NADH-quinone oxidoreductase subunit K [Alphaproteobacteria bacterium]|nr:MAG: NADH-quinone oxidoreductase subunit K [Alphaproteobacteria bacterium]